MEMKNEMNLGNHHQNSKSALCYHLVINNSISIPFVTLPDISLPTETPENPLKPLRHFGNKLIFINQMNKIL